MSRADGKRQRGAQARKAERERVRDVRKKAKREKRTGAAAVPPEEKGRKPETDPVRQGVLRAVHAVVEQGGAVLFGRDGQPFAFYPPRRAQDPGAPGRLRELVERRLGEGQG